MLKNMRCYFTHLKTTNINGLQRGGLDMKVVRPLPPQIKVSRWSPDWSSLHTVGNWFIQMDIIRALMNHHWYLSPLVNKEGELRPKQDSLSDAIVGAVSAIAACAINTP